MRVVLDLETASTADLRKVGAQVYAEHPDTRITVLCHAVDDGPVFTRRWNDIARPSASSPLFNAIRAGATIVAHNYLFEFNLYHEKMVPFGWPKIPLSQWSCTMARSLVAGYPASLELISRAARLAIPKDAGARDLMLRMARPRTRNPLTWWHETSQEHFDRLCAYCRTDVEAERLLDKHVPELSPRERAIFEVDHAINQLGINVDIGLVEQLRELAIEAKDRFVQALIRCTNGQVKSPAQVLKLRTWLAGIGVDLPDLRRPTVTAALQDNTLSGAARTALQARRDASRSSIAKLEVIAAARAWDGRLKGCFQYYGASRTGRWAGRRLQPQNLFRGSIKDVPAAITAIQQGASTADLDLLFEDSPMGVVASCMRSTIIAQPGYRLVVVDFSQIEARVLAWLAGEQASLDTFACGEDIYVATAARVGSSNRQLGKVLVLACGYGMGAAKFQATAASYGIELDILEADMLVHAWRAANQRIVDFWWNCNRALLRVARGGRPERVGHVTFIRRMGMVLIRLPSGRHLVYRWPRIEPNPDNGHDEFTYMGSLGGAWTRLRAWPGKTVENITQAVARDVMAEAMISLHKEKIPLIATVHDELIAEVHGPDADSIYNRMRLEMARTPVWASGLPMAAEGFIARRYQKK